MVDKIPSMENLVDPFTRTLTNEYLTCFISVMIWGLVGEC